MKKLTVILTSSAAFAVAFMSSEIVETMLIKGGKDGPVRINKSDFNPDEHTEYKGKEENVQSEPPQLQPSEPIVKLEDEQDNANRVVAAQHPDPKVPGNTDAVQQQAALQTAVQRTVTKTGSKYFVTDTNGEPIVADGIDPKGYKTEQEGWTAAYPPVA